MREREKRKLKKITTYIFRGWDKEDYNTHPGLKILPPIFYDLLAYIIVLSILYQVGAFLYRFI